MDYRAECWEGRKRVGLIVYRWVTPTILHVLTVINLSPCAARWMKWLVWNLPWTTLLYQRRQTRIWHHWWRTGYEHLDGHHREPSAARRVAAPHLVSA